DDGKIVGNGVVGAVQVAFADDVTTVTATPLPINVATVAELEAAANAAVAGDTIVLAEGTYILNSQIEVKSGVTYQGAGMDLTILDCNNVTRAFAAWGDRGATEGQVDANGVAIPNLTGPTGWVVDGLTIQNGVSDSANRRDILQAARDLLTNYTGSPYTLAAAQGENDGIAENPAWFEVLSGGTDDNLTDVELQAYLDNNPVGSAGHLIVNDDQVDDGGAFCLLNGTSGTVQNCVIVDCTAISAGGAVRLNNGASLMMDKCMIFGCYAEDDGGLGSMSGNDTYFSLTNSVVDGVSCGDDGGVFKSGTSAAAGVLMYNCLIVNCATGDDRLFEFKGASNQILNNTFVNNTCADKGILSERTDADNPGGELMIQNNIFAGNSNEGAKDPLIEVRYPDAMVVVMTNNLFFVNSADDGLDDDAGYIVIGENGNIEGDPLFVGPDDFHITADSPAVDAGADLGVTEDFDGNVRPQGSATDIGAYEFVAP
ncbi:choice-of-anchor Q domain-containing protein, partial [Planctomycetota bacterium]